jgi:alpha-L-fucosidase
MSPDYKVRKTPGDTSWFTQDRFGMFIHWGLYAMPARHEWVKNHEKTPEEKYDKYFKYFNPDLYDPKEWARAAKNAGMKYAVLTSKHHEGFCLFDSKFTDYKSTNTPCGRDLVKEYVEAFRAEGLRVGFYYSLLDWHHPEFPIDSLHPRRDDENREEQNKGRDIKKYAQYMRDQVTELLTNYGKIDILWFDFSYGEKGKDEWEAEKLIATARAIQPDIIIDNRTQIEQDIWTPEQVQPREWVRDDNGNLVVWELCQTFSGSWGYHREESTWLSPEMLVRMLVNTVSCGGNLLLNVGPTARGYLDSRAVAALEAIGGWMRYNSRAIYGCTQSEFKAPPDVRYTQKGNRLYVHLFAYPFRYVYLPGLAGKVDYAQFLHDASEVFYGNEENGELRIDLPRVMPCTLVPVIELFLKD